MDDRRLRFERMVKALSGDVYRYAYALCRHQATAEELVQETFMRAWRFLDTLREHDKAKSWLFTTVRREHARLYERQRVSVIEGYPLEDLPAESGEESEVLGIRRALLDLPKMYREVLVLQALGGYRGKEIAQILGIPVATVNTRLFRARERLRRLWDGADEPGRRGEMS